MCSAEADLGLPYLSSATFDVGTAVPGLQIVMVGHGGIWDLAIYNHIISHIYIKRASARVPPTPPSLGHNAIMLGLLEVVMLNVGSKCHGSCACNTRSMVQSNIVTQHLFTCLFP